ncbi:MAG TPA: bifunctional riboflavin kinase/FAD synthetase [Anaerolineales bacterium]|nr:bifunctional riboflavin kinase/FAD synthetase [Anaerolineales bacterium]
MRHYHSLEEATLKDSWLTVGVFDGVHRGHQEIIKRLVAGAHAANEPAVVLTFSPHPASVLSGHVVKCLTTPDERAELLDAINVDAVITQPFTRELSAVSAYDFMSRLKSHLGLTRLLIGYDFALGKGREGNATRLKEIGLELNYEVQMVDALSDESGVISSSAIRKLISVGDVADAVKLLGHAYGLRGSVIHGDGRGRELGFPTANIDYPSEKILPSNGIYACWAWLGEEKFAAAVNVGLRPTVRDDQTIPNVEAYLLDFDREIYGQTLKLEFIARLRDELKFASFQALIDQMYKDVEKTREMLL